MMVLIRAIQWMGGVEHIDVIAFANIVNFKILNKKCIGFFAIETKAISPRSTILSASLE